MLGTGNPVKINQPTTDKPVDFPSTIWKNGDHYNFVAQVRGSALWSS